MEQKYIKEILKLDVSKLFNTPSDRRWLGTECIEGTRSDLRMARNNFFDRINKLVRKKEEKLEWDVADCFKYCKIQCTDTPHQAIAELAKYCYQHDFKVDIRLLQYLSKQLHKEGLIKVSKKRKQKHSVD